MDARLPRALRRSGRKLLLGVCLLSLASACRKERAAPALSVQREKGFSTTPVPRENGPKLGSVANLTPIFAHPANNAVRLGYLHAGARVARSEKPIDAEGCKGGWYAIRPRGFVCLDQGATLDMTHPTLQAMALSPKLEAALPYTYAKVQKATELYSVDREHPGRVKATSKLPRHSRIAVVGSWSAKDAHDSLLRLALLTNGSFVNAAELSPVQLPKFSGVELTEQLKLPSAFVVKRGINSWTLTGEHPEPSDPLPYHVQLELTGKYRTVQGSQYWATRTETFVRHQDVTLIRLRNTFPDFVADQEKWIDISVAMGTVVLYEGKKPVFATLASVGRDRLDDENGSASTTRGTFEIVGKHITQVELDPTRPAEGYEVYNVPWVLELSSGQLLHGAFWHDRFGIEFGPGNVQLSPADARRVWSWVDPELPPGWHAAFAEDGQKRVRVVIRT